jgi:hypothetical protein
MRSDQLMRLIPQWDVILNLTLASIKNQLLDFAQVECGMLPGHQSFKFILRFHVVD